MFGGVGWGGELNDTWEWDGTSWSFLASTKVPSVQDSYRISPTVSVGGKVMLFADSGSGQLDTLWSWDGTQWTSAPAPGGPPMRFGEAAAPLGNKIILFGGFGVPAGGGAYKVNLNETWQWDGANWAQLWPTWSPPACDTGAMAPLGNKIVLFGCYGSRVCSEDAGHDAAPLDCIDAGYDPTTHDTWLWDGTNWSAATPISEPSQRASPSMATFGNRIVLFGGNGNQGPLADTWEWDGSNWHQDNPPQSPPARSQAGMANLNGALVLFGGEGLVPGSLLNDTWTWNGTTWTQGPVVPPMPLFTPPLAPLGNVLVTLEGDDQGAGRTWEWNGTAWTLKQPQTRPPTRSAHATTTLGSTVIVFGGNGVNGPLNDTWSWNGTDWSLKTSVQSPPARKYAAMAAMGSKVVLFGGANGGGGGGFNDTWEWDGTSWTQKFAQTVPPGRNQHGMAPVGSKVVMFGGWGTDSNGYVTLGDTWTWDGNDWKKETAQPSPPPRISFAMFSLLGEAVVFGGYEDGQHQLDDTWMWNGSAWNQLVTTLHPAPKVQASGAALNNVGYVFGGDAWRLGPPVDAGADAQADAASDAQADGQAPVDSSSGADGATDSSAGDTGNDGGSGGGGSGSCGCRMPNADGTSSLAAATTALLASLGFVLRARSRRERRRYEFRGIPRVR
jgi:hypothetical protein